MGIALYIYIYMDVYNMYKARGKLVIMRPEILLS